MKRILSTTLALIMVLCLAVCAHAYQNNTGNHEENVRHDIPKAANAPSIDGEITTPDEWEGALTRQLTSENVTDGLLGENGKFEGAVIYYMWDDSGLYVFAEVADSSFPQKSGYRGGSGDDAAYVSEGLHLIVYSSDAITGFLPGYLLHFSLSPTDANTSEPFVAERITLGFLTTTYDPNGTVIASKIGENGYTLEAFIPSAIFEMLDPPIQMSAGTTLPLTAYVYDRDEDGADHLYRDSTWYDSVDSNKYILTDTSAEETEDTAAPDNTPSESDTEGTQPDISDDASTSPGVGVIVIAVSVIIVICAVLAVIMIKKKKA